MADELLGTRSSARKPGAAGRIMTDRLKDGRIPKQLVAVLALVGPAVSAAPSGSGGIPPGPGPVAFGCSAAARQETTRQLGQPFDGEEAAAQRDIRAAGCVATGVVYGLR